MFCFAFSWSCENTRKAAQLTIDWPPPCYKRITTWKMETLQIPLLSIYNFKFKFWPDFIINIKCFRSPFLSACSCWEGGLGKVKPSYSYERLCPLYPRSNKKTSQVCIISQVCSEIVAQILLVWSNYSQELPCLCLGGKLEMFDDVEVIVPYNWNVQCLPSMLAR